MANTNTNQEVAVLRRWVQKRPDDTSSPAQAFGICMQSECLVPWNLAKEYDFTITESNDILTLEIDCYTAMHGPSFTPDSFDVDAWEDAKLFFYVPSSRAAYVELHRMARALLNGREVRYPNGEIIKGVVKC